MKTLITKIGILILFACTLSAHAAEEKKSPPPKPSIEKKGPKKEQTEESINPPARPVAKNGIGLFIFGDFLWWKAVQDDLQYVASTCAERMGTNTFLTSFDGKLCDPDFCFDAGFRVGIGYNTPYDGWDITFLWTRFRTSAEDCKCACPDDKISTCAVGFSAQPHLIGADCCFTEPCGKCNKCCVPCKVCCCLPCCCCPNRLVTTLAPICIQDQYGTTIQASSLWSLKLDFLDGELGREFYVSRKVTLRPFIGARGVWIYQTYNVNYCSDIHLISPPDNGFGIASGSLIGQLASCTKFDNDYIGAGPRLGLDSTWALGWGFSLYGKAALSLIWGEFDVVSDAAITLCAENTVEIETPPEIIQQTVNECARFRLCDDFQSTKAITDLQLGLQWQGIFFKERLGLLLYIGWDHHLVFNQNQLIRLKQQLNPFPLVPVVPIPPAAQVFPDLTTSQLDVEGRRSGDLSLQGLTVGARLDF